jgi:pyruvate,water dikinase
MHLIWLDEPERATPELVGRKAALLSRAQIRHPVPPGFCIPLAAEAPEPAAAYRELADRTGVADPPVAVRSSVEGEDGAGASFAGQYLTRLNVRGEGSLRAAIADCMAALDAARQRVYRDRLALGARGPSGSLLVQLMVLADASAVVFSDDAAGAIVVDASWGLGPSVVEGTVTPDSFRFRRPDLALVASTVARKQTMTVPAEHGVHQVPVPPLLRGAPSLTEAQAREAAALAMALESELGGPVDLECSWAGGRLHLLQCRPITAPLPGG